VVDVFEKIDTYLDNHVPAHTVITYYAESVPGIVVQVLPMAMLLSCLLALGQIGRQNELTAMQAAGIGVARIALPLWVMAALVSRLVFVVNEVALPHLNAKRLLLYRVDIKKQSLEGATMRTNLAYLGTDGRTFLIRTYNIPARSMDEVVIQMIRQHTLTG